MKKLFTILIAVLFVLFNAYSKPINENEAKQIALNFYNHYAPTLKSGSLVNKLITEKYEGQASFYIFGFEKGGFVMVSADDNAVPIIGYSFIGKVDSEFKSNMKYLFERYKREIGEAKLFTHKSATIDNDWYKLRHVELLGELKAVEPLLETTWDQMPLYNTKCPDATPVGCVATAMSQILNYHKWPDMGRGYSKYTPLTHPEYGEQYVDFSAQVYDWSIMPNELTVSSSMDEIRAVAALSYQAGVSVKMNYDSEGSGAQSNDVMVALTTYFKYDNSTIELINYNKTDETDYLIKIKNEIDNSRPVYYDGHGTGGGHAWVCDGYDNSDKVHINWGWGGMFNGYFLLSNMVGGSYDFTDGNSMIIGIQPSETDQDILWTKQASGFKTASRGIQNISVIDKRTAWAVASDGTGNSEPVNEFTRTIDGSNWKMGTINAEGSNGLSVGMVCAIDKNTAWISMFDGVNGGGKIVKTVDGGLNWVHQASAAFSAPNGFPNVVHFWDANNGWCQGDPNNGYFELYTTTDGGNIWTRVPKDNIPPISLKEFGTVSYYAVYEDIVWFATNKGRIYKSIDRGYNWVVFQTPITDATFDISFKNENVGIIQRRGENSNKIQYITKDGGKSWAKLSPKGNFYTSSFEYVPGENLLISTGASADVDPKKSFMGVSYSTDDGATFTDYAKLYKSFQFLALGTSGTDAIWAGGFNQDEHNDGLWHFGDFLLTAGLSTNKSDYCASENVIFTDNTFGVPDTRKWNFGEGASPATADGIGPHTVVYASTGSKNITLTIKKGSEQQVLALENYIHISETMPNAASSIAGESTVTLGDTLLYSVENQENVVFKWDFSTEWTGNSTTNEIEIGFLGAIGNGTITVTPSNGCGIGAASMLEVQVEPVGISISRNEILLLYPSPAKDFITISGAGVTEANIYNSTGLLVKKIEKAEINSQINISSFEAGVYFLAAKVNNKNYAQSFSIIK